jgi:hypothetical protein
MRYLRQVKYDSMPYCLPLSYKTKSIETKIDFNPMMTRDGGGISGAAYKFAVIILALSVMDWIVSDASAPARGPPG